MRRLRIDPGIRLAASGQDRCTAGAPATATPCPALLIAALLVASACAAGTPSPDFAAALAAAAQARTAHQVTYDGSYHRLAYPGGDVPASIGVCTDVVIRAYRGVGTDLQKLVHEDMRRAFDAYPRAWGLSRPDPNIDHRRVLNLQTFFTRHGRALRPGQDPQGYRPGDLVTWRLPGNLPHIGIISARRSADGARPLVVHNIGRGPSLEDMLFAYPITGHYRYAPGPS